MVVIEELKGEDFSEFNLQMRKENPENDEDSNVTVDGQRMVNSVA